MNLKLNDEDYKAKLAYLKDLQPSNPIIVKLDQGNTALHSIYLTNALNKALAIQKANETKPKETKENKSLSVNEIKLRHARASRGELSNSFYLCRTDIERAAVSKRILQLNKEIKLILEAIEHQEESRKVPDLPVNNEKYPVPDDPLERYKKLHSLRTTITRMQKDLVRMKLSNANEKAVMDKEQKLNDLIIYRAYVERAIQHSKIV